MKDLIILRKRSMRYQLIFLFLIIIATSVSSITILIVNRTHSLIGKNSLEVHTTMVKQTVRNINNSISSIDAYFYYLLSNRAVLNGLVQDDFGINPDTYESVLYLKDLMFSLITSTEGIKSAMYISSRGTIVTNLSGTRFPNFFNEKRFNDKPYIKEIYRNPALDFWYAEDTVENGLIYYLRGIIEPQSSKTLGILSFMVHENLFLDQISSLSLPGSAVYICDQSGYIFIHSNKEERGLYTSIDKKVLEKARPFTIENGDTLYIAYPTVNSWFVVSEISKDFLYGDNSIIIRWGVFVSVVFILLASIISIYLAQAYTSDLTAIVDTMSSSSNGDLEKMSITGSNLEFQVLTSTYNTMVSNLNKLTLSLKDEIAGKTKVENALRSLNDTLEVKVSQRTQQLEESLITLKGTQSQLVEKEKMASLGSLVAGVAHEINTPLGVCITAVSHQIQITNKLNHTFVEQLPIEEKDFENYLNDSVSLSEIVTSNLDRVAKLVMTFKQVSVDQTYEVEQIINLNEYLHNILFSLSPEIKKTETQVICSDKIKLSTFPGAFGQIFTNLVMNSLIHGFKDNRKGKILVTVTEEQEGLVIIYQDNGSGMTLETRQRIFDPFFTTDRGIGGTGLGMHIVFNLVTQQLNGQIECDSILDEYSMFTMKFPL